MTISSKLKASIESTVKDTTTAYMRKINDTFTKIKDDLQKNLELATGINRKSMVNVNPLLKNIDEVGSEAVEAVSKAKSAALTVLAEEQGDDFDEQLAAGALKKLIKDRGAAPPPLVLPPQKYVDMVAAE